MSRFKKKPLVIDAIQWRGDNWDEVYKWIMSWGLEDPGVAKDPVYSTVTVSTLEGEMRANRGDWIIHGIAGEFYPCKPDIFCSSYSEEGTEQIEELPSWHYYEAHVTIKPLKYPQDYVDLESLCRKNAFRPAKLLMQKDGRLEENDKDMFCSARSQERQDILDRTLTFVQDLMDFGFVVYRYKIESTLVDSREDMSMLQIYGEPNV